MEEILKRLSDIPKEQNVQNADQIIGKAAYLLHVEMLKSKDEFSEEIEQILLSLVTANKRQLSPVTANGIGICLLAYYKAQKKQNIWNFLNLMTEEIKRYNLTAIIVLGIVSRDLGSLFKAKLFAHISTLASSPNTAHFPFICQCFRRIIIGTGTFLEKSIPTIFMFIKRCVSATADNLRNEAIKTIPVLCSHAKIDYQKLLPVLAPTLATESNLNRYVAAKSLAKLLFAASNGEISVLTKNYLHLLQHEKNAQTVCASMFIGLRFFEPINLVAKLKTFSRFIYSVSALKVSISTMNYIVSSSLKAIFSCVGSTIGKSICSQIIDFLQTESLTISNATVLLITMQNCELPASILQQGLRFTYPLLECETKEIRDLAINFFGTLNTRDPRVGNLYLNTFLVLLEETKKTSGLISYGNAIAMLTNAKNAQKVQQLCEKLISKDKPESPTTNAALALAIGLAANGIILQTVIEKVINIATRIEIKPRITESTIQSIKYLASFMCLAKGDGRIRNIIPNFLLRVLPASNSFTCSCAFAVFSLVKAVSIEEKVATIVAKSAAAFISRVFSISDFDIDSVITPFTDDPDLIQIHFGTKNVHNFHSMFTQCLMLNGNSHKSGACRVIIEIFPDVLKAVKQNERSGIVNSLFEGNTQDSIAGLLMLVRSILQKKSTFTFLPDDTLPRLLCIRANELAVKRIVASCIGRWLHFYPMLTKPVFAALENPKKEAKFTSLIFAECSSIFTQEEYKEKAVKLCCRVAANETSAASLYALAQVIKVAKLEQFSEPAGALELVLYSGSIQTVAEIIQFCSAVNYLGDFPGTFKSACSDCLLSFYTLRNSAQLFGLSLINEYDSYADQKLERVKNLKAPPMLFVASLSLNTSLSIVPLMFTLLQQLGSKRVADALIRAFNKDPIVPVWTDLCKRIILNNCVPPAERIGDNKITPTRAVIISGMQISVLLVKKIRENFPRDINCIDTIIAIAFNAIQMKDSKIDIHAFAIVTSVIANFKDVKTNGEPFLTLFIAQLNPMFMHACEETRKFHNVADYIMEYLSFQSKFDASDVVSHITNRVEKIKINHSTALIYSRVASKIFEVSPKEFEKLRQNFNNTAIDVLQSLAKQEFPLTALGEELVSFVKAFLHTFTNQQQTRILLLLIFSQIKAIGIETAVNCASEFAKMKLLTASDIEYVLSYLSLIDKKKQEKQIETSTNDFENNAFEENAFNDEIEEHAVYVTEEEDKENTIQEFLVNASAEAEGNQFTHTRMLLLSCSMSQQPICFPAIGFLLQNAGAQETKTLLPSVFNACSLSSATDKRAEAICFSILSHLKSSQDSIPVVDSLLDNLCAHSISSVGKNILQILYLFPTFEMQSLKKLAIAINNELLPTGLTLLNELLSDTRTNDVALHLIKSGAIDYFNDLDIKDVPRALYFLNLLFKSLNDNKKGSDSMYEAIANSAMHCIALTDGVRDRQKVISIAIPLLKSIPEESAKAAFEKSTEKQTVIHALTPPRSSHASIQLISFGKTVRKSAQNHGWQTLTVEEDD